MKTPTVFPLSRPARRGARSMALIMTLAILAILTTLLVSFVSMATIDRGATKSYTQSLRAEQTALGGLDQIVSQLQAEIADPSFSKIIVPSGGGTNNIYIPLAASNAVPQRSAPSLTNLATLLSYSGTNLYQGGSAPATNSSSISSTQAKSANGRSISTARWNKPQLMLATNGFPAPQWVLMTRAGAQSFQSFNAKLADGAATNASYVVGRYAYTVYDTSGLLDANVAGYPASFSTNAAGKGLLPWADLTQVGASPAAIEKLVGWRNAATIGGYATNVFAAATNGGFTSVRNGDTTFLNRQELIKYAQTQNIGLTNALPYLTTFSRELNGPTWGPGFPLGSQTNYANLQYNSQALNPRIPMARVKDAGWTRANGVAPVVGEPLAKYRFPLDKLALLEKLKGNGGLSNDEVKQVQKYFGLDIATDANGPSYRHWTYPTASRGGNSSSGFLTLDEVAALDREPDFFELIQAGILSGSLGVPGKTPGGAQNPGRGDQRPANGNGSLTYNDVDDSVTMQVFRIGANIIDQWDADSFPTTLTFSPVPFNVYGIEDLPYPLAAFLNIYTATPNTPPFSFYIYFELWNPHQMTASSVAGTNYPAKFQLAPFYSSSLGTASDYFKGGFDAPVPKPTVWYYDGGTDLSTPQYLGDPANLRYGPTNLPFAGTPSSYREPSLIPGSTATAPPPLNGIACFTPRPLANFPTVGKPANDNNGVTTPFKAAFMTNTWSVKVQASLVMNLQYQDAGGVYRTYSTFAGMDDTGGAYPNGTGYCINGVANIMTTASLNCLAYLKSDPRTFRLGAGTDLQTSYNNANQPIATSAGVMSAPVTGNAPFGKAASIAAPYRIDMWAANDPAVTVRGASSVSPYYADIDGVTRWGDARDSYKLNNTSPIFTGSMANRPVVLNRPFQSVGELGYAYRDMAWKTLDFRSNTSADAGLLDLFTLSDAPVAAGRVSPNTPYPQVLAALVSGATQSMTNNTSISTNNALALAKALQGVTSNTPFVNRADLVDDFMTNSAITTLTPTGIKTEQEAVVRALAESANTRTWNFMIDIIAQAGRYPVTAGTLDDFVVEGERRYWLHIAIDRYTGQVVDKQLEVVNE